MRPLTLLFLCIFSLSLVAQPTISRVTPAAASPGDLVIISGSGLGAATSVQFFAVVGGFVGVWTVNVIPSSQSPTRVTAVVPQMAGFAPPNAIPPGIALGTVAIVVPDPLNPSGSTTTNLLPFHYLQAEATVTTLGTGSTQQQPGLGKAVIAFQIAGGAPIPGNNSFVLSCENSTPGSSGILAVGSPATTPYIPVGDGTLVIDLAAPYILLQPFLSDANGDIFLPAAMPPAPFGVSLSLQWGLFDPLGGFSISNGMQIDI